MTSKPITNEDLMEAFVGFRSEIVGRLNTIDDNMRSGFERVDGELEAIRSVVDNDLAGQGQVMALEGQVKEIARAVKRLEKAKA